MGIINMEAKKNIMGFLKNSKLLSFPSLMTCFLPHRQGKRDGTKRVYLFVKWFQGLWGTGPGHHHNGDMSRGNTPLRGEDEVCLRPRQGTPLATFVNTTLLSLGFGVALLGIGGWAGPTKGLFANHGDQASPIPHKVSEKQRDGLEVPGAPSAYERGGQDTLTLFALVPHQLGLTIQEQPTLYWYFSQPVPYPVHLSVTVLDNKQEEPILETIIQVVPKEGIHSVSLQDFNIRLDLDREYRWCVKLAVDKENLSRNVMVEGRIIRTVPHETLLQQLRNAEPEDLTAIYSEAGFWYDALATISELKWSPSVTRIAPKGEQRLLEQVDLMEIAKAEENITVSKDSPLSPSNSQP